MTLGLSIRKIRTQAGLTQEAAAELIGIKRSLLGAYEEGRATPSPDTLLRIARSFGRSVEELIGGEGIPKMHKIVSSYYRAPKTTRQAIDILLGIAK